MQSLGYGAFMAKQVPLTLAKAIAMPNLRRAEAGEKATTMTCLARTDQRGASALSLDLVGKMVLDYGIEDLLEVVEP